ncbi:hypothetical protein KIN20_026971 [Parelaphostrongylus tenuis]|uniref:Uncharacterized protein n=1 Tax=Parelaphostrongylus tenuis TaxID=148309 RepID=A0AAD5QYV8_PARTN|nr:hypothetical protein KIN20_026971 [Parelaphostrongylus tenuis]
MHRMVFRRLKPKSIYGPKVDKRVEQTMKTVEVSEKAKNIRVASLMIMDYYDSARNSTRFPDKFRCSDFVVGVYIPLAEILELSTA